MQSLGAISDCESSDSEPEVIDKLLSDDEADGDVLTLSDIKREAAWDDTCAATGEYIVWIWERCVCVCVCVCVRVRERECECV